MTTNLRTEALDWLTDGYPRSRRVRTVGSGIDEILADTK